MKKLSFVALVVCLATLVRTPSSWAATAPAGPSDIAPSSGDNACGIVEGDLAAIKAVQNDPSLDYLSEIKNELALRRGLLSKTILCAEASAQQAKANLDGVNVGPDLENLKNQWSDRLGSAVSYYELQLQKIGEVGIGGTESIAREVLSWRQNNYAPLAESVLGFVTWSNNQPLFAVAATRLAQINNLAGSPLFSENLDVQSDYEEAAVSLKTANDQNISAKNALAQSLAPDQSLLLIKQSLDSLSSTYQHFFAISNLIQSLLPH